jgi:hypothetical protein
MLQALQYELGARLSDRWNGLLDQFDRADKKIFNSAATFHNHSTLRNFFYPDGRGRMLAIADRFSLFFIFLSIFLLGLEFVADERTYPLFNALFLAIFAIFLFEYICRLYLAGKTYTKSIIGMIDITCIALDFVLVLALIFDGLYGAEQLTGFTKIFRLLRFLRFFRLLRLLQYRHTMRRLRTYLRPFVSAALRTLLVMLCIVGLPFFLLYISNPDNTLLKVLATLFNISNFDQSSNAAQKPLVALGLAFTGLTFLTLFTSIFNPIFARVLSRHSLDIESELKRSHIVVVANSDLGIVDEFMYVLSTYSSQKVVFVTTCPATAEKIGSNPSISVLNGEIGSRHICEQANIDEADVLVLIGDVDFDHHRFEFRVMGANAFHRHRLRILWLKSFDGSSNIDFEEGDRSELTTISHPDLTATLKDNLWRRDSLQFALYRDLLRYYDRWFEPADDLTSSAADGHRVDLPLLEDALKDACCREGLKHERRPVHNSLVVSLETPTGEHNVTADEGLLLYAVKQMIKVDGLEGRLCCGIRDFRLLEFGRSFKGEQINVDVFLFGVEFATALSVFHEITMPGVLRYWLATPNCLSFVDYQPPRRYVSKAMLEKRFTTDDCIGLCAKSSSRPLYNVVIFPNPGDKVRIPEADQIMAVAGFSKLQDKS